MRFIQIIAGSYKIWRAIRKVNRGQTNYQAVGPMVNQVLTSLGPTFIKLGQMLSLRSDLIPVALADELRQLLDHGPAIDIVEVVDLFQAEFGRRPEKIFKSFESMPFAVASLSQVHRAKLNDKELAVKVQKSGIKKVIDQDLRLAKLLVGLASIFAWTNNSREVIAILKTMLEEFFRWINHELDYRLEALNLSRIKHNFVEEKYFVAPDIIHEYSSKKILTMTFIEGVSLNELIDKVKNLEHAPTIQYGKVKIPKKIFIDRAVKIVYKQVFEDGYFHADPHPANILITPQGALAYIDFGVIGILQPHLRESIVKIVAGIVERDIKAIAEGLIELDEIEGHKPVAELEKRIRGLLDDWQTGTVIEMTVAEVFFRLMIIAQECGIEIPLPVYIIGKTILEYDGMLRKFEPTLDIVQAFRPFIEGQFEPAVFKALPHTLEEVLKHPQNLPKEALDLAKALAEDGVQFVTQLLSGKMRQK